MRSIAGWPVALWAGRGLGVYYIYVLFSSKDTHFYVGYTKDLMKRVEAHNVGAVDATKSRRPLKLVYYEACLSENAALVREKQLKTGFGRAYLKTRINIVRP